MAEIEKPFIFDQLKPLMPYKRNPFHDDPKIKELFEDYFEFSCLSRERYKKVWDVTAFSAWFHPFTTDFERYLNSARKMQVFFIFDDHDIGKDLTASLKLWDQFDEMLDRLSLMVDPEDGKFISMATWKPFIMLQYAVMEEICQKYSRVQKRRFIQCFRDYMIGSQKEVALVGRKHVMQSLDELYEVRVDSVGVIPCFQMIEYCDDIELTDEEWDDPLMKEYIRYCTIASIVGNDIPSFNKEYEEYKFDLNLMYNSVALVIRNEKCSVNTAKWRTAEKYRDIQLRALELKRQLLEREGREEFKKFVNLVPYVVGGNHVGSSYTYRYVKDYDLI